MKTPMPRKIFLVSIVAAMMQTGFAQERNLILTSGSEYSYIGIDVGINASGVVAFTANEAAGSAAFTIDEEGTVLRHTFQSANRTFGPSVAINNHNPPQIAVRDRVSGSPPTFLIRRWAANATIGSTLIGNSGDGDYDSASFRADINNSAVVAFSALVSGSTATELLAGDSQGTLTSLAVFPTATSLYPQISDDNFIIIRDTSNRIITYRHPIIGVAEVIASPGAGFSNVGRAPGIANSSAILAFSGERSSGKGVFIALKGSGERVVFRLAGEGADMLTDVDLDSRVGVTATGTLSQGLHVAAVFSGTFNGVEGIYAAGGNAIEEAGVIAFTAGPPVQIAAVGIPTEYKLPDGGSVTKTISVFGLYDPINTRRQIVFGSQFTDGTTGIVRVDPCAISPTAAPGYQPFKQFDVSGYLVDGLSSSGTFLNYGCAISSFATAIDKVSRAEGLPVPTLGPRPLQQWLRARGMQDSSGRVAFATLKYWAAFVSGVSQQLRVESVRPNGSEQFAFDDIITELTNARPVILGVPSLSTTATLADHLVGNKIHYVAAVEYDEGLGMLYGKASGILINDPGYGASRYSDTIGGYGDVPKETGITPNYLRIGFVSLQDYFAALSRKGGVAAAAAQQLKADYLGCTGDDIIRDSTRIEEWFGRGIIYRRGIVSPSSIPSSSKQKLITKVRTTIGIGLPLLGPTLQIASPVELVLTDSVTGQRYATSYPLLFPEDILLEKIAMDLVEPVDIEDTQFIDLNFPPYVISLPSAAYGHTLNVQIHGVGDGSFEINYQHTDAAYMSPSSIVGSVSNMQQINGVFTLVASSNLLRIAQLTKIGPSQFKITWDPLSDVTVLFSETLAHESWQTIVQVSGTNSWTGAAPNNEQRGFFRIQIY